MAAIGSPGGEGCVWQAEYLAPDGAHPTPGLSRGDFVALKILNHEDHGDNIDEFEDRWRRIADFYARQDWHPNLVRTYERPFRGRLPRHPEDDYYEKGADTLYLPMEYLEGNSLQKHVLPGKDKPPAPFPVRRSYLRGLEGIADGLAELATVPGDGSSGSVLSKRAGLVHRDVKPDNIIFPPGRTPVLVDFGAMREMGTSRRYTGISGTAGYAAPEMADESVAWELQVTPAVDLYGLACVAYFTLSGQNPPAQQSTWERHFERFLPDAVSRETRHLLRKVLTQEDPEQRLLIDIAGWTRELTASAFPQQTTRRPAAAPAPVKAVMPSSPKPVPATDQSPVTTTSTAIPKHRSTPRAPVVDTPTPATTPGHQNPRRRSRSSAPTKSPAKSPQNSPKTPQTKSRTPQYIYLKNRGEIVSVPSRAGEIGTLTANKQTYKYTLPYLKKSHLNKFSVGKTAYYRTDSNNSVDYVSVTTDRINLDGSPAPYREEPYIAMFVGIMLAVASSFTVQYFWAVDNSWWETLLLTIGLVFFSGYGLAVLIASREDKLPDYEYRTWWDEHNFMRIYAGVVLFGGTAFGAAWGSGGTPIVDRYVSAWATGDGLWAIILRGLAHVILGVAVFMLISIILDVLWITFSKKTHLPAPSAGKVLWIVVKIISVAAVCVTLYALK